MNIKIRNETAADRPAIEAVTISAFLNAPHTSHTEQFIVSALREAGLLTLGRWLRRNSHFPRLIRWSNSHVAENS